MESYITGMTVPYMPEDKQAIIRAHIGLFEIRGLKRDKENELVTGPFDVRVRESVDTRGHTVPNIKWLTGNEGMLEYKVDGKGNLLAWMADDEWWHNRLYIMDNPDFRAGLSNLHTHLGIISGMDAMEHIRLLEVELKHEIEILDVYVNGKLRFSARDKEMADQEIDKQKRVFTSVKDGKIELQKEKDKTYNIVSRKVLKYKPEITALIQRNRRERLKFGWTSCPEFMNEIKPKVIKEIQALGLNPTMPGQVSSRDIIEGIGKMTDAQRKALAEALLKKTDVPPDGEPGPLPETAQEQTPAKKKHAGGRPKKAAATVEG